MVPRGLVQVSAEDRVRPELVVQDGNAKQKHVWRALLIPESPDGNGTIEIMRRVGDLKPTIWRWQARHARWRADGLLRDATRPPGKGPVPANEVRNVELTNSPPPGKATHWTPRAMANQVGFVWSTVRLIWRKHMFMPHFVRTFKPSRDPAFADRLHDAVGPYVNPPEHAVVRSIDEQSQIQALDRTQVPLPMKTDPPETRTHDYVRHDTTIVFSALNILDDTVFGRHYQRHRQEEFISILDHPAASFQYQEVHVVLDYYSTHMTATAHQLLAEHPNWTFHFTPTSASWLNAVEGFFARHSRWRLKHAIFKSLRSREGVILRFIEELNGREATTFRWAADTENIIAARKRGFALIDSRHKCSVRRLLHRPSNPIRSLHK